jgi:hypothetical protein
MYAVEIVDGQVVRTIVASAEWATTNLGGQWIDSEVLVHFPGTWDETYGFRPEQPGPDCWWENDQWVCPEPPPSPPDPF